MPNQFTAAEISGDKIPKGKFAIVVSRFNEEITGNLLSGASQALVEKGVDDSQIDVVFVPGAWEIPLIVKRLAKSASYQAVICLGAVIKGQTSHDQHINHFVSTALGNLGLEFEIPITFGILTVENRQQAIDRSGGSVANRGTDAALAAIEMCVLNQEIDRAN